MESILKGEQTIQPSPQKTIILAFSSIWGIGLSNNMSNDGVLLAAE
jgi:hypothetical protein